MPTGSNTTIGFPDDIKEIGAEPAATAQRRGSTPFCFQTRQPAWLSCNVRRHVFHVGSVLRRDLTPPPGNNDSGRSKGPKKGKGLFFAAVPPPAKVESSTQSVRAYRPPRRRRYCIESGHRWYRAKTEAGIRAMPRCGDGAQRPAADRGKGRLVEQCRYS